MKNLFIYNSIVYLSVFLNKMLKIGSGRCPTVVKIFLILCCVVYYFLPKMNVRKISLTSMSFTNMIITKESNNFPTHKYIVWTNDFHIRYSN